MNPKIERLRYASKTAVAVMAVLLIGAFYFYKERMLFIDAAHICFRILNNKTFNIEEHRYGSFITQMVPLIGLKLHLSLRAILLAYSVSFNLFYFIIILFLVYRYWQYGMAILMALYYTLFVSDAYFWTNNEVHQGIAWMFLFFAVSFHKAANHQGKVSQFFIFLVLAALAIFTHPLIMISTLFLWGYLYFDKEQWPYNKGQTILYSLLLIIIVIVKFRTSNGASYDGDKLKQTMHIDLDSIKNALQNPMLHTFLRHCLYNYWIAVLVAITGLATLAKQGKWLLLIWTVVAAAGFVILMSLTYIGAYDRHVQFYMESEWMTLSIIMATPFVLNFLPLLRPNIAVWLLFSIFIVRFIYIGMAAPAFTERISFVEQGLQQMRKKRLTKVVLIKENSEIEDKLLMDWGLPDESLMASVMDGDRPALTYTQMPADQLANGVPKDTKTMIASFQLINDGLNTTYFPIDTLRPYTVLSYENFYK